MTEYRVVIDSKQCVDCGISVGRCPVHARLLAKVLKPASKNTKGDFLSMGVFDENNYDYVKKLVDSCPEHALIIKKVDST